MVENMCRVCLESEEGNSFKNMQIPYMENEEAIAIMFSGIGKVKYAPNDGLPQKICEQCLNELIFCNEFQKKCIQSDIEIRKFLDSREFEKVGESEIKTEISSVHSDDEKYENISIIKIEEFQIERHQINHRTESLASHIKKHQSSTAQLGKRKGWELEIEMEMDTSLSDNENICDNSLERRNKAVKSAIESKSQNQINAEVKTNIKTLEFSDCTDTEYENDTSRDAVAKEENISNKKLLGITQNIIVNDMKVELSDPKNKSKTIHKCAICNKIFDRKYSLRRHLSVHNIEGFPFECVICKWRFASQKNLTNHEVKHITKKIQCSYCPRKFVKKESLALHIKRVHKLHDPKNKSKAIHKCAICNKIFDRKYCLQRHLSVHNIEGFPFECVICKWRFASQKNLTNHEVKHKNEVKHITKNNQTVSQCSYCPRKFVKNESLASHIKRVHKSHVPKDKESDEKEKNFKCQFCSKSFNQIISLARHLYIHDDEKDFNCNFCDKNFSQAKYLVEHIQWHKSAHFFQCQICTKSFSQPYNLKDHMRSHSGEKPYLCSECGMAFYDSSTLRQHIKRHSGEKPFECSECPSKFTFSGDLKSHMLTHAKLKPYACDLCESKFKKRSSLNKHNLIHTREKPHECKTCHIKFRQKGHLKRHNLTHTGEKPHSCKYCGKAYVQSNELINHLKTHLGDKIYKCSKCKESFRLQVELRDHLNEHYRKEKHVKERLEDINKDTKEV